MKRTVMIFGATGEIGGRTACLTARAGHRVIGVCRNPKRIAGHLADLSGVTFEFGDKNDETFLASLEEKYHPEVLIDTLANESMVEPFIRNFPGVENVLFCSSTGAFVPLQYFPADENHPWREDTGVNFAHQSRWDIKALAEYEKGRFPVTILRPTNIIGEGPVPLDLWGGRSLEFYRRLKAGEPVEISVDLQTLVQPAYNWDLASAFALAVDHPDTTRGEIFIISSRKAITLGRFLETAMEFLHSKSEIRHVERQKLLESNPLVSWRFGLEFLELHMCFDIGKAQRILGYDPQVSPEEGLRRALARQIELGAL